MDSIIDDIKRLRQFDPKDSIILVLFSVYPMFKQSYGTFKRTHLSKIERASGRPIADPSRSIKTEDEVNNEEHKLRIKKCLRCQESNSPTSSFCSRCGSPLDMKTATQLHEEESKIDNVMDNLLEDPEVKGLLLSKLKAMAT